MMSYYGGRFAHIQNKRRKRTMKDIGILIYISKRRLTVISYNPLILSSRY